METESLLQLLSTSATQLKTLYEEIGDPSSSYTNALQELHTTLTTSIQSHLSAAQGRVQEIKEDCVAREQEITLLQIALEQREGEDKGVGKTSQTLHQRQQAAHQQVQSLRHVYDSRQSEAASLLQRINDQKQVLENFVQLPAQLPLSASRPDAEWAKAIEALPLSYLSALQNEAQRGEAEIFARSTQLQGHLEEIFAHWSELHHAPDALNDDFDAQILTHLQVKPIWHLAPVSGTQDGAAHAIFQGEFEPFENTARDPDVFAPPVSAAPTPTRKSSGNDANTPPNCLQVKQASTPLPPSIMPTLANLQRAADKRKMLEEEKGRRELRIQSLYDELSELWMKFDVPEDEMDAFVQTHCGSTRDVIEAYQRELQKMQDLRREHMALFIEKVRERIRRLWDTLRLSEEERFHSFPPCFEDQTVATEDMLEKHEEAIARLSEEVKVKSPVLEIIGRYQAICDEEKQMEEDAKDPNRFKNTRGDPGRLLREEKTRKRIKVQKPKFQQELLKAIPEWEAEHGKQFTIDGVPYLEVLRELVGEAQKDSKKRSRTASSTSSTSSRDAHGTLTASTTHNRSAATPMRGVPATPNIGSTAKRPRLAPPSSTARSDASHVMPPPSTTSVRHGATASRLAKAAPHSSLRAPSGAKSAVPVGTTAKLRAPPSFRPRPSAMLQAYVGSGGGRRSAEHTPDNANAPRIASHSSDGSVIVHDRPPPSFALRDSFGDTGVRTVMGLTSHALSAGPNWCAVEEE